MTFRPTVRAITTGLCVLAGSGFLLSCGGGSMSSEGPKLKQIIIAPANPPVPKGASVQLTATGMFDDGKERTLDGSPAWQTSQSAIAKIDAQGNVTGMSEGVAQVSATYKGLSGNTQISVGPAALLSIAVSPSQASLPVGVSQQLTATGKFSDGTVQDLTQSATWSSSGPAIASVSAVGTAVAQAVGTATISAASGSVTGSATLAITLAAMISLNITPATVSISLGTSHQLQAIATWTDGTSQNVSGNATWSSSQLAFATVDTQGNVTGVGKGAAQVSAAYQGITGSAAVNVGAAALLSITVSPNPPSLPVGESQQLTATGKYTDGSVQNLSQSATWTSSGAAIASVSPGGSVVAHATGTATISATSGSITGSASLTVAPPAVTALNVAPATFSMIMQGSHQLRAMATFSDGTTQDMTKTVAWSSMQPNIATVTNAGMAMAMQVGSTTILAQTNGVTGSADVTVVPLALVNYFNYAAAASSGADGTVRLANPGLAPGDVCAMVYVFDQSQELNECCGCSISDSGLRTLSVTNDLTANPLTGTRPRIGEIKVVPSDPAQNPQCNPASLAPAGALAGWGANVQVTGGGVQMTETPFAIVTLTTAEQAFLANMCSFVQKLGSGKGICSCGTGD
jgi:hypothetical protein